MATLDVLDYAVALEQALAPHMHPAERKMAVRETRRVIDDMAFRFAFMEGRVLPEDEDYRRALAALRSPEATADVLARRQPAYRKRRVRKNVVTAVILAFLVVTGGLFWTYVTSEESVVLVDGWTTGAGEPVEASYQESFVVDDNVTRLRFMAEVLVLSSDDATPANAMTVVLLDPDGETRIMREFRSGDAVSHMRESIEQPKRGEWEVYVTYRDIAASAEITVLGVRAV